MQQNPTIDSFFQQLTEANQKWMQGWVNSLSPTAAPTQHVTALHEALGQFSHNPAEWLSHHNEYYRQHREAGRDIKKMRRIDYAANRDRINAQ